jgi:hypothetical protein
MLGADDRRTALRTDAYPRTSEILDDPLFDSACSN